MNSSEIIEGLVYAHTSPGGGGAIDYTGVLALAAGAVLVALAIPFLHVREGTAARPRRWAYRAAAVVAGSLVVYAFVYPIIQLAGTHEHQKPIADVPGASDSPVTSRARQPAKAARDR